MEYNYQYVYDYPTGQSPVIATNRILRLPDNATIPNDIENTDWQQYQVWLSEGHTPLPPA
jgi:hypothetical protein